MEVRESLTAAADASKETAARRGLLAQVKFASAASADVEAAAPLLLPLLQDGAPDIRRLAVALAEEAAKACPSTIPALVPALLACLDDDSPPTLKRVLAAVTVLLRPTLLLLLKAEEDAAALAALEPAWQGLRALRETAGKLLVSSSADSVRTAAAKVCEAIVLAYTDESDVPASAEAAAATETASAVAHGGEEAGWRLSLLPVDGTHPLLSRSALEAEGEAALVLIGDTVLSPPSATVLLVLITGCVSLGKQRPSLLGRVSATLSELGQRLLGRASSLSALPSHQLANAQQSLRSSLLSLLKLPTARELPAVESCLAEALRALGATEQLKHFYKQIGFEPPPPPGLPSDGASEGEAVAGAAIGGKRAEHPDGDEGGAAGAKRPKVEEGTAQPDPRSAVRPRIAQLGASELDAVLSRLGPHLIAQLVIAAMAELPVRPPTPPPAESGGAAAVAPEHKPLVLSSPAALDARACAGIAAEVLESLLSSSREAQLEARGLGGTRAALIGRLAATQPEESPFCRRLHDYLLESPVSRAPLATAWLHSEIASASPHDDLGRHDRLACSLLPRMVTALSEHGAACAELLLEVPRLRAEWLAPILHLPQLFPPPSATATPSEGTASPAAALALATLRTLALKRDALSSHCLTHLVGIATSEHAAHRAAATAHLATELAISPQLAREVSLAADAHIDAAFAQPWPAVPPSAAADPSASAASAAAAAALEQEVERRLSLPIALCVREPERLWGVLSAAARAEVPVQQAVGRRLGSRAQAFESAPLGAALLSAMRQLPPADASALFTPLLECVAAASASDRPLVPELLEGVPTLCVQQLHDVRYAVPLLGCLPPMAAEALLPLAIGSSPEVAKAALVTLMHASTPPVPPARLLLLLHQMPTDGPHKIGLKQVIDAVQTCVAEQSVFTMQVMAEALQAIVQLDPWPLLLMRTAIQALRSHPLLAEFTVGLLRHLVSRAVWKTKSLWTGFIKCCEQCQPQAYAVVLALPAPQLAEVLQQSPDMRAPLTSYAASHLADLSAEVRDALGLAEEEEAFEL